MSRRTKLIAVRVGASCTGSGFFHKKPSLIPLLLLSAKGHVRLAVLPTFCGRAYSA